MTWESWTLLIIVVALLLGIIWELRYEHRVLHPDQDRLSNN